MNVRTQSLRLHGAAGAIEALRDEPHQPLGLALIAHPHPLFGGTMHNKVVQTLARACVQAGWTALRFNFRGVGQSAGEHDGGRGECDDMLHLAVQCAQQQPLLLAGFSFGAAVAACVASRLEMPPAHLLLAGLAVQRIEVPPLPEALRERTLLLHGEVDDVVPLGAVLDWARPQSLPVTVLPAAGHFFHGQLPQLKRCALRHLGAL